MVQRARASAAAPKWSRDVLWATFVMNWGDYAGAGEILEKALGQAPPVDASSSCAEIRA